MPSLDLHFNAATAQALLDSLPLGAALLGAAENFIYLNAQFTKITGYDLKDMPDLTTCLRLAHPDPLKRAEILRAISDLRQKKLKEFNFLMICKNGTLAEMELRLKELPDGTTLILLSDISEHLKTEVDLRLSEARYRGMVEHFSDGVFQTTPQGELLRCNPSMARMLGYENPAEAIRALRDFTLAYVRPSERYELLRLIETNGSARDFEVQLFRKNRRKIWVSLTVRAMCDISGGIELIEAVAEDVTSRKQAEMERMLLVAAVEQAAEAVVITDARWRVEYANPAFGDIMLLSRKKSLGKDFRNLVVMGPEIGAFEDIQALLEGGLDWTGRMKSAARLAPRRMVEVLISAIREASGRITHHVILARDMSYEASLEERLRQAQKLEAVGTLASGIAHDFNNILTPLVLNAEMALEDLGPEHPASQPLGEVLRAGKRAGMLVKQILTFSRQGGRILGPQQFAPLLKETLRLVRSTLEPNMDILLELPDEELTVLSDPTQIHQVLMNLCTNAVHAMRGRGGTLSLTLCRHEAKPGGLPPGLVGSYARLAVKDTGHGMDKEVLKRVFEPFFTTKKPGEGTGMGLSTVHGIVRACGGAISVSSELGVGSCFEVYLPLAGTQAPLPEDGQANLVRGAERILMVDHDREFLESCANRLSILGYQVRVKANPLKALKLFLSAPHDYDLLLTENQMPAMSGLQLAEACRGVRPDLPVVMLASSVDPKLILQNFRSCLSEVAIKPLPSIELAKALRRALASARLR